MPSNSVNVGAWYVMGTTRTIWPILFSVTKTSQWWITYILQAPVCSVLNYTSRTETCNQQCVCYVWHFSVMWWKRFSVPLIWQVKILTATHWTKMCGPQFNSKLEHRTVTVLPAILANGLTTEWCIGPFQILLDYNKMPF